jgi:peptide/nickel transport system permease protein
MIRYAAKRVVLAIPVLIGVSLVSFMLMRLVPGDPALALLGTEADAAAIATLRKTLALDRPLMAQFAAWFSRLWEGDFGRSIATGRPVLPMAMGALEATASLAIAAVGLAVLIGVPLGVFAATRRTSVGAGTVEIASVLGLSMPSFWVGLLLIFAFAIRVPVLPASGYVPLAEDPAGHLAYLALPALTLGVALAASTLRITRTAMLQSLRAPHIRTALAKGVSARRVVWRHAFVAARATILVQLAVQVGKLFGGAVVVETLFSWPGIGKLTVDAVFARDYPVLQGAVLLAAVIFVLINLLADIGHAMADPRVRQR